jgi:hypothetical protein
MFLDYTLYRNNFSNVCIGDMTVGPDLTQYVLGDAKIEQCLEDFVDAFDIWLPIIPWRKFRSWVPISERKLSGEDVLLIACVKNLAQLVPGDDPSTKTYLTIKSAILNAELAGFITTSLLQALVLLLVYEIGHGIYPCAYTTLGTCIRYLVVLGIDGAGPTVDQPDKWIEIEIRRRLWWAVYIMER